GQRDSGKHIMNRNSKILGVLLVVAACAATVLKADDKTNKNNSALFPDKVIATGKGVEIKRSRLDEAVTSVRSTAMARGRKIPPGERPRIEKSSFNHLLQMQLLNAKATDADKPTGKKEGDRRMDAIRQRAPSPEMLARQLKSLDLTVEELNRRLVEEA